RSLKALLATSWRISVMSDAPPSHCACQELDESADKRFLKPVAIDPETGPGGIDAAQKQIIDAAEMLLVAITGQAQTEIAIQRGGVELVLEIVVPTADLRRERGRAVILDPVAQPVGLPVHEVVAG